MDKLLRAVCIVTFTYALLYVNNHFGNVEGFRFWGVGLLALSIFLLFKEKVELVMGGKKLGVSFEGAEKLLIVLPILITAIAILLKPYDVACIVHVKSFVCN
ncbi:hypothetical protein [Photobacterium sanguinicancri]|uniref:hypothetical protein n=1 Tax=Photobacterium sanguinicancri TaxID=875932 RepID=UPI003D0BF8E6